MAIKELIMYIDYLYRNDIHTTNLTTKIKKRRKVKEEITFWNIINNMIKKDKYKMMLYKLL